MVLAKQKRQWVSHFICGFRLSIDAIPSLHILPALIAAFLIVQAALPICTFSIQPFRPGRTSQRQLLASPLQPDGGKALLRWGAGSTCMEALVVKVRWRAFCNYLRNGLICWHMKMYSAYSVVYYIERESMRNILASGKCLCKIWSCKCQWKVSISTYSIFLIME